MGFLWALFTSQLVPQGCPIRRTCRTRTDPRRFPQCCSPIARPCVVNQPKCTCPRDGFQMEITLGFFRPTQRTQIRQSMQEMDNYLTRHKHGIYVGVFNGWITSFGMHAN